MTLDEIEQHVNEHHYARHTTVSRGGQEGLACIIVADGQWHIQYEGDPVIDTFPDLAGLIDQHPGLPQDGWEVRPRYLFRAKKMELLHTDVGVPHSASESGEAHETSEVRLQ